MKEICLTNKNNVHQTVTFLFMVFYWTVQRRQRFTNDKNKIKTPSFLNSGGCCYVKDNL